MDKNDNLCIHIPFKINSMDAKRLKQEQTKLFDFFWTNGYSKDYIRAFKSFIRKIIELDGDDSVKTYEDFFNYFSPERGYKQTSAALRRRRNIIGAIKEFDLHDHYPNRVSRTGFMSRSSYNQLIPAFKKVVDNYRQSKSASVKSSGTVKSEMNNSSTFFLSIQHQGVCKLEDIGERHVLRVFFDGEKRTHGYSYKKNVLAVLKANKEHTTWSECEKIINYLPCLKEERKNFPFLNKEEVERIRQGLCNRELSLRDTAIVSLVFHTALRGSDIAGLKVGDINWETEELSIVQSKTGNPLKLPIRPAVGNAIYDYLSERKNLEPASPLFESIQLQGAHISSKAVSNIVRSMLKSYGVRVNGGQKGLRVMRHHLATDLIANGIPSSVVSAILGHASPVSVYPYVDAVVDKLRGCALSIDKYPVREEVFDV